MKKYREGMVAREGFTLIELMVTVLIFSFLVGGIYTTLLVGSDSWKVNQTRVALQQEVRRAMEMMKYELCQTGPGAIFDVFPDGNWHSAITFKIPSGVSGGTIAWGANTIQFVQGGADPTNVYRVEGTNRRLIGQHIQTLQFRRQPTATDILEVSLVAADNAAGSHTITYQLDFEVQLRN